MSGIEPELMAIFRDEVAETVDALASSLEALAGDPGDRLKECIDDSFRHAHNLKGAARMVDQASVVELTHAMEDRLSGFRESMECPPAELLDRMMRAITMIQRIVDGDDLVEAAAELAESILDEDAGAAPRTEGPSGGDDRTEPAAASGPDDSGAPDSGAPDSGNSDPGETPTEPESAGVLATDETPSERLRPTAGDVEAEQGAPIVNAVAAQRDGEALPAAVPSPCQPIDWASPSSPEATASDSDPSDSAEGQENPGGTERPSSDAANSVRVEVGRLDQLMSHIGEMPVLHARFGARNNRYRRLANDLTEFYKSLPTEDQPRLSEHLKEFETLLLSDKQELASFGYLTDEVIAATKRVRMMPLDRLSAQWRRIVRESAQEVDKTVQLHTEVSEIEVDKHILDTLRDPFMHLLRNAVDHGIEPPDIRHACGKPATGRVTIGARTRGTRVDITVSDDGRGLDPGRIGRRALKKHVVTSEQLAEMSEQEILGLLFAPGFSTADSVSQLSGRGVGLDVVRKALRDLGGDASIEDSPIGTGTTFRLTVPASLVSTRGLLVQVGDSVLAFPIEHVDRTLLVPTEELVALNGSSAITQDDGTPLEVRWLHETFGFAQEDGSGNLVVVVVKGIAGRVGIVVSSLVGEEEFVTKPLPWNLRSVPGVSGAVIRADGTVAAVVDVSDLVTRDQATVEARRADVAEEVDGQKRILVVDDSLTSRSLEKSILEAAGYEVMLATDGEEGWETLQHTEVDLVVSDVEMPRCTGLELAGRVRASDRHRELPLILVTSLGSKADLAAGARAGADEYIVKGQFDQGQLLDAVGRLV